MFLSHSSFRGLFIIDPNGVVKHMSVNDLPVGRCVEETLRLVKAFQFVETHGEVCPASWTPESPTVSSLDTSQATLLPSQCISVFFLHTSFSHLRKGRPNLPYVTLLFFRSNRPQKDPRSTLKKSTDSLHRFQLQQHKPKSKWNTLSTSKLYLLKHRLIHQ